MKNIFLTSAIIAVMSYPAIALDGNNHIEPSPETDCVESTLGTATGPANLEADWTANTINLEWYNEDTKLTVPTTSNTCRYDGQLTLPSTNPEKTGYTFRGWQVRVAQQCSLSGLDMSINGTTYGYARLDGNAGENESTYGLTVPGEWAVEFEYGTVKGMAKCSSTNGTYGQTGAPSNTDGGYCWCGTTGFDAEKDGAYCSVASPSWVFYNDASSASGCVEDCVNNCAYDVQNFSDFRAALFGGQ